MYTIIIYDITGKYTRHFSKHRPSITDGMLNIFLDTSTQLTYNISNIISYKVTKGASDEEN